jgi:hypothetical protein
MRPTSPVTAGPEEATRWGPGDEILGDTTSDAVVQAINNRMNRRNYAIPIGLVISAGLFALSVPWQIVAVIGAVSIILVTAQHLRSKYTDLVYGSEEETAMRLNTLQKAVAALRSADSAWSVREASLDNGLTPNPPTLRRTKLAGEPPLLPKHVRTNITPAALRFTDCTLYFFPDRLFVWHSGRFAAIDYANLNLRSSRVMFLERETRPPDAAIESQMRRSLTDENLIPVLYYGLVDIDAPPALQARLMISRPECAQEFVAQMRAITGGVESAAQEEGGQEALYTHFDPGRVPLFFNLTEDGFRQLQRARDAFAILAGCDYVWRSQEETRTDDWKRNAGASTLVRRSRVAVTLVEKAPGFESNAAFGLGVGNSTLFLLPDGFVTYVDHRYGVVGKSLDVNVSECSFREEEANPRDAQVIGTTWRFVNKKGGPDLRFKDNREIPIYRYGQVEISCGSWQVRLCLSRAEAAVEFATAIRAALSSEAPGSENDKTASGLTDIAAALRVLGLQPGASFEDASAAYKNLAAQNHPDKVAHMASEFRQLADRRMRELNAAYDRIRTFYKQR